MNCIFKDICSNYDSTGVCENLKSCYKKTKSSTLHFNADSVQANFIKGFLSEQVIPIYDSVRINDYIVAGTKYVYGDKVIKATQSGNMGDDGSYVVVGDQPFGVHYVKHSEVFQSCNQTYDSTTHEKLGDFLRYYRDIKDINLMPLYNCNSARQTQAFTLVRSSGVLEVYNKTCKLYMVPIKYNRTYTIAMDCTSDFSVAPALIINNKLLKVTIEDFPESPSTLLFTKENTLFKIGASFNYPYTLEVNTKSLPDRQQQILQTFEKQLYLLVQVSQSCESSLVVLEGDYTNPMYPINIETGSLPTTNIYTYDPDTYFSTRSEVTFTSQLDVPAAERQYVKYGDGEILYMCINTHTIYKTDTTKWIVENFQPVTNYKAQCLSKCVDKKELFGLDENEIDTFYYGKLFLLQMNDGVQHPISNNLLSYLVNNCITSEDIIANNVKKSETALLYTSHAINRTSNGIWDIQLRDNLFSVVMEDPTINNLDELGYVTKKLETHLEKLNSDIIW